MPQNSWQVEVARLFEYCAQCLRARQDRQSVVAFGTAIAYLQRAEADGARTASDLLAQFSGASADDRTKRFSFSPGELEELTGRTREK
jgi:hypothetical protein